MSTYSKNLFDILGDGEVARPVPVKEEAPVVVDKKSVSKINKDGKFFFIFGLILHNSRYSYSTLSLFPMKKITQPTKATT